MVGRDWLGWLRAGEGLEWSWLKVKDLLFSGFSFR